MQSIPFQKPKKSKETGFLLSTNLVKVNNAHNRYLEKTLHVIEIKTLLPSSTNQRTNSYLKEIATACKIKKTLTTHLARHTFATTVTLSNGGTH